MNESDILLQFWKQKKRIAICICLSILCGCTAVKEDETTPNRGYNADIKDSPAKAYSNTRNRSVSFEPDIISKEVNEFEISTESATARAKIIANHITKLDEVERASTVVTGNTAIVGIEMVGTLEDAKLIKLKNNVEREVKSIDAGIKHVAVTAASDLVQRITNMADSASIDDTAPQYNRRMEEIIQKLTPPM